jgi:hypothetical protein
MITGKRIWKKVVNRIYSSNKYNRIGEGKTEHILECGHSVLTKQSYGAPARMHCNECQGSGFANVRI